MIGDPFKLVPSSLESSPFNLTPPDGSFTSLLPQLPPSNYQTTQEGTKATPNVSLQDLLNVASQRTIAPEYEYGFEEERRYSNPYLQFNPKPMGGYDTEDIYGKFQGGGEQLWNSLVKTGATAAGSFISGFTTFGSSIDALRGGKPFDEDSTLGQTQGWLKELEDKYPNYYTQWEREHPYQSAVSSTGFVNFWGDKVLKNVGFTIGSLGSSFIVDAGINLLTEGAAAPSTFILAANQIKNAIAPLKNAFRSLSKVSTLNKVDDLAGISRVGVGINEGLKNLNRAYDLKKALQFAGTTYFAAQGEAMIEGYQTYWDTKAKLYKQELEKGTLDINKITEIEELSQEAANTTTALNLPIIMASNLLQFPTIFGGKNILKQFDSPFLDVINKEGLTVVNNYSRKQAWVNTMKELSKDFVSEGGEEGYQYYVGNSIHDYYVDKFNGTATNTLSEYLGKQLPQTVKSEDFWESFVIGGLAGGLMGSHHTIKRNLIGANDRAEKARETLQPVYDRFNSSVKDYVHFAENVEHSADNNEVNQFHSAHKALFSTVHDSLKYGIYDNFQDSLEDLRNLPLEEYNKLFGTELTEQERFSQLNKIQGESLKIKDDLTQVNKFFQTNPFDSSYVNQRLKDIYKLDQTQVENVKAKLFQDYKELVTYNISRLRNTRGKISEVEEELKTMGLDDSIVPVLYNLDSPKGLKEYKKLKQVQANALKEEVEYYKTLEQSTPELNLKVKSLDKLIKELDKYPEESEEFQDSHKESFRKLIFMEEIGERQLINEEEFKKKEEQLRKQQEIATKTAEELEKQTTKPETKVKEQVETLDKLIPKEEKKVKPPTSPNAEIVFNKNFGPLEPGDEFKVDLSTESGVFTLLTKSPFVAEKNGVKYQFTPTGVIKHDNGEQRLRYALDNIGVEKVGETKPAQGVVKVADKKSATRFTREDILSKTAKVSGQPVVEVNLVTSQLKVGDKIKFFAEKERTGTWDGNKIIEDKTKNPWSITAILNDLTGWIEVIEVIDIEQPVIPVKEKKEKKVISEQQKIKQAVDKLRTQSTSTIQDGIYLLEGDNKFAWRYIDENTAVPLTLKMKGNKLVYEGDMTKGVDKKITEGYLLDDQYIKETPAVNLEQKKADIERRRQNEISSYKPLKELEEDIEDLQYNLDNFRGNEQKRFELESELERLKMQLMKGKIVIEKINAKYDAELKSLTEQEQKGIDITSLLEDEPVFGIDITELLQEETIGSEKQPLSLSELSNQLKQGKNQKANLDKFLTEPISDQLRQILEWRLGKGVTIDC